MDLSRTVPEIDGDFSRKSQSFPIPCILRPAEGVPLGIGNWRWELENENHGSIGPTNKFDDIFSHLDTKHQRDRRTDTGRQQRPHLRTA